MSIESDFYNLLKKANNNLETINTLENTLSNKEKFLGISVLIFIVLSFGIYFGYTWVAICAGFAFFIWLGINIAFYLFLDNNPVNLKQLHQEQVIVVETLQSQLIKIFKEKINSYNNLPIIPSDIILKERLEAYMLEFMDQLFPDPILLEIMDDCQTIRLDPLTLINRYANIYKTITI